MVTTNLLRSGTEYVQGIWVSGINVIVPRIVTHYDTRDIEFYGGYVLLYRISVQLIFFWLPTLVFTVFDFLPPHLCPLTKLQAARRPTTLQLLDGIKITIRNMGLAKILLYLGVYYSPSQRVSFSPTLPSVFTVVWQIIYASTIREIYYYWAHRAFHHPLLYARFHKKHHQFTAPVAWSTAYFSLTEHVLVNILMLIVPHAILGPERVHIVGLWVYHAITQISAVMDHSGYEMPGIGFPMPGFRDQWVWIKAPTKNHDLHHELFDCYFSHLGFLDWLHGTDEKGMRERRKIRREAKGFVVEEVKSED